jgi:NADH:ubiquinone reductase (H+-translocating)
MSGPAKILIAGGGYVGLYTALRLQRKLKRGEAEITLVDPRSYMTYQPFLPEAAAGSLEPRHVVVPLRKVLPKVRIINARVIGVDHARRCAQVQPIVGSAYDVGYDTVVVALGSVSRTLPIPGLAGHGLGFKTVEEAIYLRNRVLSCLDVAESTEDEARRRRALTFVVVGGGYAGVEALAEVEDMARYACRYYTRVTPSDMRWILVEASERILPEVGEEMGRYTVEQLRGRGIEVRLNTRLASCVEGRIELSDGDQFEAETLVWTAGVKPSPAVSHTDFPLDDRGRIRCLPDLRMTGDAGVLEGAWSAGDNAAVPDLTGAPGALCSPSAQHAVRQAARLGDNVISVLRGKTPKDYRHSYVGSVASLGLHKGVAQIYGIKLRGFVAWFMHRSYHVSRVPTFNRKVRVIIDWTLALFFRREVVSLGALHRPYDEFEKATHGTAETEIRG